MATDPRDEPAPTPSLVLRYPSAGDVWRDRLPDVRRGVIGRSAGKLEPGDEVDLSLVVEREGVTVSARATVLWVTPLARASLLGLELAGASHRDDVQIDLLLGLRGVGLDGRAPGAGGPDTTPIPVAPQRALPITILQPSAVIRGVIATALARFARGEGGRWDLQLDAVGDTAQFLAVVARRRPKLAIVDCDRIASAADPLVEAVRSSAAHARLPLVLLSGDRSPRLEDRFTVTMRKPVAMKALVHTVDLLLRG